MPHKNTTQARLARTHLLNYYWATKRSSLKIHPNKQQIAKDILLMIKIIKSENKRNFRLEKMKR